LVRREKVKKIYIDDTALNSGHAVRGMGVYTKNLIDSLEVLVEKHKNIKISKDNYELIHYPYFDLFFNTLKVEPEVKTIVTVPDVIPLIYPKEYPPGIKGKLNFLLQKRQLKKADSIVTISETSKKDIVRFLKIDPKKIFVTYLAPNFKFKKTSRNKIKLPKKFVLYVGDVNWNKNLLTLAKACKQSNIKLVVVGKAANNSSFDKNHKENASLVEFLDKFAGDKDIVRTGYLKNVDLNEVWNKAFIYCQPSFYEGFGLGVLEAMQAGVPVIASRTQALVEVAGNAALFFDPKSSKDLSEKMNMLIDNKPLREKYVKKGINRAKDFSWEKTAKSTLDIYNKFL